MSDQLVAWASVAVYGVGLLAFVLLVLWTHPDAVAARRARRQRDVAVRRAVADLDDELRRLLHG